MRPLINFAFQQGSELLRRAAHRIGTGVDERLPHLGRLQRGIDCGIKFADDALWRTARRRNTEPCCRVITRYAGATKPDTSMNSAQLVPVLIIFSLRYVFSAP